MFLLRNSYKFFSESSFSSSGPAEIYTNTLTTGFTLYEDWDLTIDVKFPWTQASSGWKNVFGLQVDGVQNLEAGSRIPSLFLLDHDYASVWFTASQSETGFQALGNGWNGDWWITLKLSQTNGIYEVRIGSRLVTSVARHAQTWRNVNVVIGNTYGGIYQPAVGEYRNFVITSRSKS